MKNKLSFEDPAQHVVGLTPYKQVLKALGMSATTGWRLRQRGWLRTICVAGKLYVSCKDFQMFLARAEKGEFTPKKRHADV